MGGLIGAIFEKIFESLFERGVETVGQNAQRHRAFRRILLALAVISAAWIAVASAFLWHTERLPDIFGLVAYVEGGGPLWQLATPLVAVLTIIWLLIPVFGRHSITFFLGAATFGLTLGSLAEYQGGKYATDISVPITFLAAMLLAIFGIVLALTDVPPLDAPLARLAFVYWGRFKHLHALRQYGMERGLTVSGPAGKGNAMTLEGMYDREHPITITSAASYSFTGNAPAFTLSVKMGSPRDIIAMRISYEQPPKKARARVVGGECRAKGKPTIYFYVVPEPGQVIPPDFVPRMAEIVEAGRPFLRRRDFAHATPFGIRFTHRDARHLTVQDAQLDPAIGWMRELLGVLEPISPAPVRVGSSRDAAPW